MLWRGGPARYVYVTEPDAENPGVPPNLDLPRGTRWRLDVLASQPALASGVAFGTTPAGSVQAYPERTVAEDLVAGARYRLYVLRDVGLPLANCTFTFGEPRVASDAAEAIEAPDRAPECDGQSPGEAFGRPCSDARTHRECGCGADYCAIQPGQSTGYCTAAGCTEDESVCPPDWSCFDLSRFDPTAPSVCLAPPP
jgi:hypothetical protein